MKNQQHKSKTWRNLYDENWKLCKQIADLRYGHVCQIQGCKNRNLQLDHVFSRRIRILFFEPDNLGWLCREHHTHKSFRKGQWVDKQVNDLCIKRIGADRWYFLMSESRKLCPEFSTIYYQEKVNKYLRSRAKKALEDEKTLRT